MLFFVSDLTLLLTQRMLRQLKADLFSILDNFVQQAALLDDL